MKKCYLIRNLRTGAYLQNTSENKSPWGSLDAARTFTKKTAKEIISTLFVNDPYQILEVYW